MERRLCAFEHCFVAHGQSYGLRAQDADLLDRLASRVSLGWQAPAVTLGEISPWYELRRADDPKRPYRLTVGDESLIESLDLPVVLDAFDRHAERKSWSGACSSRKDGANSLPRRYKPQ